jgi:hypothetical protein
MGLIAASQSRLMDARKRMGESSRRVEGRSRIRQPTGADQARRDDESDQQNNQDAMLGLGFRPSARPPVDPPAVRHFISPNEETLSTP